MKYNMDDADFLLVKVRALYAELNKQEQKAKKLIVEIEDLPKLKKLKMKKYVTILAKTAVTLSHLSTEILTMGDVDDV